MSLESRIASKARELVEAKDTLEVQKGYRSLCEGFPILLRTAGLRQAAGFLEAKRKNREMPGSQKEHALLCAHLEAQFRNLGVLDTRATLGQLAAVESLQKYRLYSQLALRIAFWHKRLAQALLEKEG